MKLFVSIVMTLFVLIAPAVASAFSSSEGEGFIPVNGPCRLEFPSAHGPHPGYRTEWWYYTGNLKTAGGERFGFQLTFFRRQIVPADKESTWPSPHSEWRTTDVFLAHAALTDVSGKKFHHAEQMSRAALGIAGAHSQGDDTTVFVRNWSSRIAPSMHILQADMKDFAFNLKLLPLKPAVLHGESGYSLKGLNPGSASCYYSCTRLEAAGTVQLAGKNLPVTGSAWMDHEFSSAPLEPGLAGWDWFGLQFSDNSELMVYMMREKDGSFSATSSGIFVDSSGNAVHLRAEDIEAVPAAYWLSPASGARYPVTWNLRILPLGLDLSISPRLVDQEMQTPGTAAVTYWEGSVEVTGTSGKTPVDGEGYLELTGYDKPMDSRF